MARWAAGIRCREACALAFLGCLVAVVVAPSADAAPAPGSGGTVLGLPIVSSLSAGSPPNPLAIVPNTVQDVLGNPSPLVFPADDSAHSGHVEEWWQWWLDLQTPDGRRFGAVVVFFDFPLSSALETAGVGIRRTDFRLTDLSDGSFHYGSKYSTDPMVIVPNGFNLAAGGQAASGGNGHDSVHIAVDGYSLDATVTTQRPPIPLGNPDGYFQLDPIEAARVYDRYRMTTSGTLQKDGRTMQFIGASSFEHGWGTIPPTISWDYFHLHLSDGRDMQIAQGRRAPGTPNFLYTGVIRDNQDHVTYLHQGDFEIVPTGTWQRDATCSYPSGWIIRVKGDQFTMTPSLKNQEVISLYGSFWDGETAITGSANGDGIAEILNDCPLPQPLSLLH